MLSTLLTILIVFTPYQISHKISDAEKKGFIETLKTLPVKGEFYTEEAISRAKPFMPVLFALTESDLAKYDVYPFLALSSGLAEREENRRYAVRHFAEIQHPVLKLGWAVMLFDAKAATPEIVRFLRYASKAKKQSDLLAEMLGPKYSDFQRRINAYSESKR